MLRPLLACRFAALAAGGIDAMTARLHATLGTDPAQTDWTLRRAAGEDGAFDRDTLHEAASALAAGGKTDAKRADGLFAWLALPDGDKCLIFSMW